MMQYAIYSSRIEIIRERKMSHLSLSAHIGHTPLGVLLPRSLPSSLSAEEYLVQW